MKHPRALLRRTLGLCLAALLAVPVFAAEPSDTAAKRREDLNFLYQEVLAKHPGGFVNAPESVFPALKAEIEICLETETDTEFLLDLMRLTALAGDSHTAISVGSAANFRAYPFSMIRRGESWYLSAVTPEDGGLLCQEVTALAGKPVAEVVNAFGTLFSSDNPVHLRRQFRQACNVADIYEYLGLVDAGKPITVTLKNGKNLSLAPMDREDMVKLELITISSKIQGQPETAAADANYLSMPLNETTYYIQYNACVEDEDLSMEDFAAKVWGDLDIGVYSRIVLDLRNNGGGSDGLIWPVLEAVQSSTSRGAELVGLIGEATFSSALINAVEIQEMGGVLVGEATGGSVCHFGAVKTFTLPNSKVRGQMSSKYLDLNTLLDAAAGRGVEALEPDVEVFQTLEDTLNGRDTAVEWLLSHPEKLSQREYPDAPLTRGRFIGQLYEALGRPDASWDNPPFSDCFGIEWYLHPLNWAYQKGIALGAADGTFSGARPITWKEASAFLTRAADVLNLEAAPGHRSGPIPAALSSISNSTVMAAWELGVLPTDADPAKPITRAQGEAMAAALAKLKG